MSAYLILNKMPERCEDCILKYNYQSIRDYCTAVPRHDRIKDVRRKPDWCPLRPYPSKMETKGVYAPESYFREAIGWNKCLDVLMENSNKTAKGEFRMQRNKYLDDLGIPPEKYGTNFCSDDDDRAETWKKEREEYSFDERECWNLDDTFIEWLYSHLKKFADDAIVDLDYHKFEFKGKTYTQIEAIDFILERLERALVYETTDCADGWDKYNIEEVREAILMWAEIFPACWW